MMNSHAIIFIEIIWILSIDKEIKVGWLQIHLCEVNMFEMKYINDFEWVIHLFVFVFYLRLIFEFLNL